MKRLRNFASITALFSDREIDEMQAAIDARREARAERGDPAQDVDQTQAGATGPGTPEGGRRAG
jgi:hypothetical protein